MVQHFDVFDIYNDGKIDAADLVYLLRFVHPRAMVAPRFFFINFTSCPRTAGSWGSR